MSRRGIQADINKGLISLALATVCLATEMSSAIVMAGQDTIAVSDEIRRVAIDMERGWLRVNAQDAELSELIGEIARISGIRIKIEGPAIDSVTVRFDAVTVRRAIASLLHGRSYVLAERLDGSLEVRLLYSGNKAAPQVDAELVFSNIEGPAMDPFKSDNDLMAELDALTGETDLDQLLEDNYFDQSPSPY